MNKYVNLKLAIDSESVDIYIETGGEPVHVVYWHLDEWEEDAESSVPASLMAVDLFHTDPDELIKKLLNPFDGKDIRESLITKKEIKRFRKDWGQDHLEICCCLGFDPEDDEGSSEDIMNTGNYFWDEEKDLWLNKHASGFQGKDQLIADYLRNL